MRIRGRSGTRMLAYALTTRLKVLNAGGVDSNYEGVRDWLRQCGFGGRLPMVTVNVKAGFVERAPSRCPPLTLRVLQTSTNGSSTGTSGIAAMAPPPTRHKLFLHQTLAGSNSQQRNIGRRAAGVGLVLSARKAFL